MSRLKSRPDILYVGVGGHAVALSPDSGDELWRTKLKGASYVTVQVVDQRIYAGAGGELFCLDARTGTILWHNKLKGLGLGIVAFAGSDASVSHAALTAQQAAAVAAAT